MTADVMWATTESGLLLPPSLHGDAGPSVTASREVPTAPAKAKPERWEKDVTWRSYLAEVALWPLTAGAYAVAYWSQVQVVFQHAFHGDTVIFAGVSWSALIWGLSTELGALVALFEAREASHRGTPSWGAWIIASACTAMSLAYNLKAGADAGSGDLWGIGAHVWMPVLALGCWAWILEGRRVKWNPRFRERMTKLMAGSATVTTNANAQNHDKTSSPQERKIERPAPREREPRQSSRPPADLTDEQKAQRKRELTAERNRRLRARRKEAVAGV